MSRSRSLIGLSLGLALHAQAQITYVDAHPANTQAVGGSPNPFYTTSTTADNLWRFRSGFGWDAGGQNGIYEKDGDTGGYGDAVKLQTTISGLVPGQSYGIYMNWLTAASNSWQIQAGLSANALTTFTPSSPSGRVENLGQSSESGSNRSQLRGFIGNATADASGHIVVFIDDGNGTSTSQRSWYDAVSYGPPLLPPAEPGVELAADGVWTWFNDPRTLWHHGTLYTGFVRISDGRSCINACDPTTGTYSTVMTSGWTEKDDHDNPGILIRQDGKLMAFYSRHGGVNSYSYRTSTSTTPTTPADWGAEQTYATPAGNSYCNPFQLSDEGGKIYHFSRAIGWDPNWTEFDSAGSLLTPIRQFINAGSTSQRPYAKYWSNDKDRIEILYTDGHPDAMATNVYHAVITGGNVRKSDGSLLKPLANAPLQHDSDERGSVVYPYSTAATTDYDDHIPGGRGWVWDLVHDPKTDQPVAVFSVQRSNVTGSSGFKDDRIYYYYATWSPETGWRRRFIAQAGRPLYNTQRNYAGGICVDPNDPRVIYISTNAANPFSLTDINNVPLSTNERYFLYRGITLDGGLTFHWTPLTAGASYDSLRPYVPRGNSPYTREVIFFHGTYTTYTSWNTRVRGFFENPKTGYNSWRASKPAMVGTSGEPGEDADGDGIKNLHEYAFGGDPLVPDAAHAGYPKIISSGENPTLAFQRDLTRTDLNYTVETSTNLTDWEPLPTSVSQLQGMIETQVAHIPESPSTTRFYRVQVTRTP